MAAEEREKKGKELEAKKRYDTSAQNFYPSRIFTDTCILTLISPGKCSFCVNPPSGMPSPSVTTLFPHAAQLLTPHDSFARPPCNQAQPESVTRPSTPLTHKNRQHPNDQPTLSAPLIGLHTPANFRRILRQSLARHTSAFLLLVISLSSSATFYNLLPQRTSGNDRCAVRRRSGERRTRHPLRILGRRR